LIIHRLFPFSVRQIISSYPVVVRALSVCTSDGAVTAHLFALDAWQYLSCLHCRADFVVLPTGVHKFNQFGDFEKVVLVVGRKLCGARGLEGRVAARLSKRRGTYGLMLHCVRRAGGSGSIVRCVSKAVNGCVWFWAGYE
jgi:hypothetical protein